MLVVTAGLSLTENLKYHIYYDPVERTHTLPFDYIGLYCEKAIRAVGKVVHEVMCEFKNGKLMDIEGLGSLSKDELKRVMEIIVNTKYYDLTTNTRFFLVDHFYNTLSPKRRGSVRGKQYLFLKDQFENFKERMSSADLAKLINDKNWD